MNYYIIIHKTTELQLNSHTWHTPKKAFYEVYLKKTGSCRAILIATITKKHSHAYEIGITPAGQEHPFYHGEKWETRETLEDALNFIKSEFYNEYDIREIWTNYMEY